jgi:ribosomal-protein-alanine N-acetyltransferase
MQSIYTTERLSLSKLTIHDATFIKELVNTNEWIKYIGNRNINTAEDAKNYVRKIMSNPAINYWVVTLKGVSIGIITLIKREYLEHYDIGFAFLPLFFKNGYAYEAAKAVLEDAMNNNNHQKILAVTVEDNINSIKLLEKLEMRFEKKIKNENDVLFIFSR